MAKGTPPPPAWSWFSLTQEIWKGVSLSQKKAVTALMRVFCTQEWPDATFREVRDTRPWLSWCAEISKRYLATQPSLCLWTRFTLRNWEQISDDKYPVLTEDVQEPPGAHCSLRATKPRGAGCAHSRDKDTQSDGPLTLLEESAQKYLVPETQGYVNTAHEGGRPGDPRRTAVSRETDRWNGYVLQGTTKNKISYFLRVSFLVLCPKNYLMVCFHPQKWS